MKNVGIKKYQLHRVVKDFNLNVSICKKNGDLNEKWKIVTIESLVFLILGNFQNCKFLKTWIEMFCSLLLEKLMVDSGCAYDPCGPKKLEKRS
jgi:hypothetical protein